MKIIDLLNKIANGEEVPKAIRFGKIIYEYEEGIDYINGEGLDKKFLIDKICISQEDLNDEIEILDEPKKIEKLNTNIINANRYDYDKNKEMTISNIAADILSISKVVNELIDEVNKLKEE